MRKPTAASAGNAGWRCDPSSSQIFVSMKKTNVAADIRRSKQVIVEEDKQEGARCF
jgi:hypothetical protein